MTGEHQLCVACKKPFLKSHGSKKYCTPECRIKAGNKITYKKLKKVKSGMTVTHTCRVCFKQFEKKYGKLGRRGYCSVVCRKERLNELNRIHSEIVKQIKSKMTVTHTCKVCLKRYEKKYGKSGRRGYCSLVCKKQRQIDLRKLRYKTTGK